MMEITFKNKKLNIQKLLSFGFIEQNGEYIFSADLVDGLMKMTVTVSQDGNIYTKVIDKSTNEEYVLHRVAGASGSFVGQVKTEYQNILDEISVKCFEPDVFKSYFSHKVIDYVRNTYGDELEFLWQRFPDNAIFRRKDTGKWYGALLTVSKHKLGIESDEVIDIIDLRIKAEDIEAVADNKKYFPGYHMNKKHWYTICLDGSVPIEEIYRRIDESYNLATK